MTLAEISSSTVFERSSVSGPSSRHHWVLFGPSEDYTGLPAAAGSEIVVLGSTAPGTSGTPGTGVFLHGGATLHIAVLLMSGKLTCCTASR